MVCLAIGWMVARLLRWFTGWAGVWLHGWLAGRLVDWLVGLFYAALLKIYVLLVLCESQINSCNYAIIAYKWGDSKANVGKYTIHGVIIWDYRNSSSALS